MRKFQSRNAGHPADAGYNTVRHLEEMGTHDEGLWHLQEIVAAEIEALYP